jgi:hypothetical protein
MRVSVGLTHGVGTAPRVKVGSKIYGNTESVLQIGTNE